MTTSGKSARSRAHAATGEHAPGAKSGTRPARRGASKPSGELPIDTPWTMIVYRVPTDSSRARVAVWRDLKRMGGLYLQQCVCVLPKTDALAGQVGSVRDRIARLGGTSNLFELSMDDPQRQQLIEDFRDLAARDYAEIIEECETRFVKEIEFERFREKYTFEEVEEIRHDLEKIQRWFRRVSARDFFDAPGRSETEAWIDRCSQLLDAFEDDVYTRTAGDDARDS